MDASVASDILQVRRHRIDCAMSDAAQRAGAEEQILSVARDALPEALERIAHGLFSGGDTVVLIRRLTLDIDIDFGANGERIAEAWARCLLRSAVAAERAPQTITFANRREQLARFLMDLARGTAWRLWYHREFDGLRPLTRSAAIRTALQRAPGTARTVLAEMPRGERHLVIETLGDADARRLLAEILPPGSGRPRVRDLAALAGAVFAAACKVPLPHLSTPQAALRIIADSDAVFAAAGASGSRWLLDFVTAAHNLAGTAPERLRRLSADLVANGSPSRRLGPALPKSFASLDPAARAELAEELNRQSLAIAPADATTEESAAEAATPFGGAFLIWPQVAALPIEAIFVAPAEVCDTLRWLILCRAFGLENQAAIRADPVLAGIFLPAAAAQDLSSIVPEADGGTDSLALDIWALEEGTKTAAWCSVGPATAPTELLKSRPHGYWLRVGARRSSHPFAPTDPRRATPDTDARDAAALLETPGDRIGQLAQIALKRLAYRIPGYADSSQSYLIRNFLSMPARVTETAAGLDAALGSVPLDVMLNLTGLARQSYDLPGEPGRRVRLSQQGDVP